MPEPCPICAQLSAGMVCPKVYAPRLSGLLRGGVGAGGVAMPIHTLYWRF